MPLIPLTISNDYGYVLWAVGGLCVQCYLTGFEINFIRKKIFTKDFMQQNFSEVHKKELGQNLGSMGFPDTGSGRYSEKLSYRNWYLFNLAQRTHLNFVEQIGVVVPMLLAGGVYYPKLAACLGWTYFFGRLLYRLTYKSKGARGRRAGSYVFIPTILGLAALTFMTGYKMITQGLKK